MSGDRCKIIGCPRGNTESGGAKGMCAKHYQAARRADAGVAVRSEPIAAPGEGGEVTFRLPRSTKDELAELALVHGFDSPSAFLRALVRGFLKIRTSGERRTLLDSGRC